MATKKPLVLYGADIEEMRDGDKLPSSVIPEIASGKSLTGLVPAMTSASQDGFVVTASTEYSSDYAAWKVFERLYGEWATAGQGTGAWIKIELPEPRKIWRVDIKARLSSEWISKFTIEGSNSATGPYFTLGTFVFPLVLDTTFSFPIDYSDAYKYYRIYANETIGTNPGLRSIQLYPIAE